MADATLEEQNAALEAAVLQEHHHNHAALGPALLAPRIGGGKNATTWVGGSNKPEDARTHP